MTLSDFLNLEANLHAREELFNHRLLFDLKSACAENGKYLRTYYSDVDHDGFDVIFEDGYNLRKIQLKTVAKTAGTSAWDIHRSILRPLACNCEELGFDYPTAVGVEGGVVLIEYEIDTTQKMSVSYSYTDVYVINAIALKFIDRHGNTVNAAKNLRETIRKGEPNEKISVARGMFLHAAVPQNLLRLVGMHSSVPHAGWQFRLREMSRLEWGPKTKDDEGDNPLTQRNTAFRKELPDVIKSICGCDP